MSEVSRIHYLVSALKGHALECISDLAVLADNFSIAWKTLESLLATHLPMLLNLSALPRKSATNLQALRDRVNITLVSLRNLVRSPADLWNDILVHIVWQKLDPTTRKAWNIKTRDDVTPSPFDVLQNFINSRVRALEDFASRSLTKSVPSRSLSGTCVQPSPARVHLATVRPRPAHCVGSDII